MLDPDLYQKALEFAVTAHKDQKVPGSSKPYLTHLCAVASEVLANPDVATNLNFAVVVALLHDTLEDCDLSQDVLTAQFGEAVAQAVAALSKNSALPKEQRMADSLARILLQPPEVATVKLADRTINMGPPPAFWKPEKCRAYREEAELILEKLGAASPHQSTRLRARIAAYPV